ncbi:sulfatase-like hydrolase/transferase [Aureibaculum luteum]|uniref:sulfatase-like hydrolase/transferase n=1 Tax=Aureibaculum luteum TaxID=1548456 RepID=UPI000E4C6178|nr:sulfatase-like hydrolase/transferase [Aureibaculum luteum]
MKTSVKLFFLIAFLIIPLALCAQDKEPNVFLITLDGVRWQEVFTGIDSKLIENESYTENKEQLTSLFEGNTPEEKRKKLMPFFWNTIANKGQLYGNRNAGSKVDVINKMVFSYPGYNEILSGFSDDENIDSNNKEYNKNTTILEKVNNLPAYKGKVAAFASWDVFPYIINDKRSGIPVNAGYMDASENLNAQEVLLNEMQWLAPIIWKNVRLDVFTHHFAKEYIKKNNPKLVYIAYGETDDFAHDGSFNSYIKSLKNTDALIEDLWDYVQENEFYKNNTYFIITTDHGRGVGVEKSSSWTSHGKEVIGATQTWLAVLGPKIEAKGEIKEDTQFYNNQVAATVLELLKVSVSKEKMGEPVPTILK